MKINKLILTKNVLEIQETDSKQAKYADHWKKETEGNSVAQSLRHCMRVV